MARSTVNRLLMVLSAHLLLNGCGGEPSAPNTPPTASAGPDQDVNRGDLVALTPTSFLPTDSRVDGNRGYALAFIGAEDGPARHLVNGVFAMRRRD